MTDLRLTWGTGVLCTDANVGHREFHDTEKYPDSWSQQNVILKNLTFGLGEYHTEEITHQLSKVSCGEEGFYDVASE